MATQLRARLPRYVEKDSWPGGWQAATQPEMPLSRPPHSPHPGSVSFRLPALAVIRAASCLPKRPSP